MARRQGRPCGAGATTNGSGSGLAAARAEHRRVVGRPLGAAVPAVVLVEAVAAALAVGLVVLGVVGDEVPEREAVVAGDEVDRVLRLAARRLVQVGAAAQPAGQRPRQPRLAAP